MTDRGQPVRSLRLVLGKDGPSQSGQIEVAAAITDENGYAQFSDLSPGSFLLSAEHDVLGNNTIVIVSSASGPKNVTVNLTWPGDRVLQAKSMSGTFRGPDFYPQGTQVQLSLSLLDGRSGREIGATQTDAKGAFNFTGDVPPGIYYLRLNPSNLRGWGGEQMEGAIPVEVGPRAAHDNLDVDVTWSSCGLGYAQRVARPEFTVNKMCGNVLDVEGAAIARAQVILMVDDGNMKIMEGTETGSTGEFALRQQTGGTYQLLVKSPGFQPFLGVVHMNPAEASERCQKPIRVRMEVGGF